MTAGSWGEVARKLLGRGLGAGGPPSQISASPVNSIPPFPTCLTPTLHHVNAL